MTRSTDLVRLVGGPPKLDGVVYDLRLSARDRSDAEGDQFVRAVRGTTITSLAGLQEHCQDHRRATELAAGWRAALYRPTGWRRRVRAYRFVGYYSLEARRDALGRWTVGLRGRVAGTDLAPPPPVTTVWATLDATVDGAAARFAAVAALLPEGPLAHRVRAAEQAVATCVADARRLSAVGTFLAPDGTPTADAHVPALLAQITALVRTIDAATREVVALHLEVHEHDDPVGPLTQLNESWTEVSVSGHAIDGDPYGPLVSLPVADSDVGGSDDPT
jgi:hypothetical protein